MRPIGLAVASVVAAAAVAVPIGLTAGQPEADRDCSDFATQGQAQSFFLANGGPTSDPHRLDADDDGIACERNPGAAPGGGEGSLAETTDTTSSPTVDTTEPTETRELTIEPEPPFNPEIHNVK